MDNILAARPATHPPVLLETLKPVESPSDSDVTDVEEQGGSAQEQSDSCSKEDDNQSESGTVSLSSTPVSPHSDGSIKGAGTEDIVKKDKAGIKERKGKEARVKCVKML